MSRVLVAGGKGVGKSTFLRWFTNKLLSSGPVLFLDLDPGQAELGLPGYLSMSALTSSVSSAMASRGTSWSTAT